MRHVSAVVLILLLGTTIVEGQVELAGAKRPNLKVLQQLPESQLFSVMNLVATSLGVRCDFCHVQENPNLAKSPSNVGGWQWAKDDKPQKRKAREMMQMVIELNANRFNGEHRVTCYTCHQGSTRPARTPPIPPPAPGTGKTPVPATLPDIERVWANYIAAMGGTAALAPGNGTILSGWDDRPEGRYSKVEVALTADRYKITLSNAEGTTTQGFDAEGAWVVANGAVQRLPAPADAARMRRIAMRYRPLHERPANLEVIGVSSIGGHDAYVTRAKPDSLTTYTWYFDVVTGLLRRELITTETMLLPLMDQIDYDDYRPVDGVPFPFTLRTTDGAPYSLVTRTFLQIRHNVPVADSLLRPR